MPITKWDVKKHNKEAAEKAPEKYAKIFNSAYNACKDSKGKLAKKAGMKSCDEYAARTANAKWKS